MLSVTAHPHFSLAPDLHIHLFAKNLFPTAKSTLAEFAQSLVDKHTAEKSLSGELGPSQGEAGRLSAFWCQLSQVPFCSQCRATVFTFGGFSWVISLFKMACKPSAEVLSGVPKCKKAGCALCVK